MSSSSSGDGSSPTSDSSSDSSSSSNNNSPPPPDSSDSSSSSPPPPDSSSSSSPPPPSEESPPPPQDSNDSQSPPPPPSDSSSDNSSPPPPSSNDDNNNNDKSPPPPPPPPPPPKSSSSNGDSSPPPPPHHSGALSPPKHKSSPSEDSKHKETSSNEKDVTAGAIAGAALLLLVLIALLVCCCCRKKKKRRPTGYYMDNSQQSRNDYFNNGQHLNWHNTRSSSDNLLRMPPSGQVSSEQGWPIAPPPPPPMMCSSEMSSAAFSGQAPLPPPHPAMALGFNQSTFTYEDLAAATGGFAQANLLGQGGFGYVHKGVLPNGKEVAVKSLKANSGQGEREFQAEVEIISRVHHRHLVSLVGYCIAGAQRMLVYEFVTNNTLEHHLHGKGRPVMDFPTRLKIAIGSAKGLAYLHEDCHPRIIHRDIKTPNILLDSNFEAKVADFGLAKLSSDTNTHVSTRIMGTFGYLAPEYAASGKLSEKSDVFSYGVMLLELVTGKHPVDVNEDESLVDWARPILMHAADGGSYQEMVDPRLEDNYDPDEMLRMVASAGACIRHSARRRPKMSQIVRALEGDVSLEDLNGLKTPGQSPAYLSGGGSDYDSYQMDIRKPRSGMSSQEFTSGEYGGESQEMRPIVSRRPNP